MRAKTEIFLTQKHSPAPGLTAKFPKVAFLETSPEILLSTPLYLKISAHFTLLNHSLHLRAKFSKKSKKEEQTHKLRESTQRVLI